jgi:aspartate racemase
MRIENIQFHSKPIIGLLGGCGPHATLDIERKILSATCSIRTPVNDQDYYPMVVLYITQLQDRNQAKNRGVDDLILQLNASIEQLISLKSDILLLACQSAHVFLNKIQPVLDKVLFVNMIDVTIKRILSYPMKWKRIGLIGTDVLYGSNLYQNSLKSKGIQVVTPPQSLQKHVMQAIYTIKTHGTDFLYSIKGSSASFNKETNSTNQIFSRISEELTLSVHYITDTINYLLDQNVDGVILGCTELPLLLPYLTPKFSENILIDPNQLSAEQAVLYACEMERNTADRAWILEQTL